MQRTNEYHSGGIVMTERLTKKQIEEYEELRSARDNGRLLTPNGLRFICEAHNNDPESIGKHFLEVLAKFRAEKII